MSLFARLILLVLIAAAPVVGLEIYREMELREVRRDEVMKEAEDLLYLVRDQQRHTIDEVRQILITLGQTDAVRGQDASRCQELMRRLHPEYPEFFEIWVTDNTGAVTCATEDNVVGTSVADQSHFRQARAGTDLAIGFPIANSSSGKAVLPFAISFRDKDGIAAGAILANLDLSWLKAYLAGRSLSDSAGLLLADRRGTILLRVPDSPGSVGSMLPERFRPLLTGNRSGIVEMEGVDGEQRIIAYSPPSEDMRNLFMSIGIDSREVDLRMDGALFQSWFLLSFAAALLVAVWFGGRLFVVKPVNALLDATRRWQKGDRTARVRFSDHTSELGQLGLAFDAMADGLDAEISRRELAHNAVQVAEARLRAIVDTAVDAMIVVDHAGTIQSFNPAAERIFGHCAAETIGRDISLLVPRHDWPGQATGTGLEVEGRRKGGETFPLELSVATWVLDGQLYYSGIMRDVSARKRAEREREALRAELDAERTRLQAVVRHMSIGLLVVDASSGRLVLHNEEAERLLRQPLSFEGIDEFVRYGGRRPDGSPMAPEDYPIARAILKGEVILQEETSYLRGDGTPTVLSVDATPVHEESGAIALVICTFQDISARKAMEQALRQSEERLSIALSSAEAGTWDWDIATNRTTWSDQTYRLLGVEIGRAVTQDDCFQAIHPDDRTSVAESMRDDLRRRRTDYHSEFRIIHPRKGERWLEVIGRATYAADGTPLRLSGLGIDITGRKQMEEALRRSKEHLRLALASAQAGTWEWDMRTGEATWSDAVFRMHHLDPARDNALYEAWVEAAHPDDREGMVRAIEETLNGTQGIYRMEYRVLDAAGNVRWLEALGRATYANDGRPMRLNGISLDITERKALEGELQRAKAIAEEASLAKTRFLAAASHDLRQPIQSMLLFTSSLGAHVHDPEGTDKLRHLERSMDALKGLLDSLLDVSRLDAGQISPQIEDFSLETLLEEIRTSYAAIAAGKNLLWQVSSCGTVVRSDPNLLGRMVRNLVENALRYTEEGFIQVECHDVDGRTRIEVRDSGIGIPPDHAESIWQEFHQVGNPERDREQGLGLGLAIVRRLGRLLNHRTDMRSVPGEGSVFSIEVPKGTAEVSAAKPVAERQQGPASNGGGRVALVVDDDAMVLAALGAILQDWGYEVITAGMIDEALAKVDGTRCPDVIIADYRLRDGRVGTEVILRVRDRVGLAVPAVLLTGEMGQECRRDADMHGFDLIHKPVTPQQLGNVLQKQLEEA